MHSINPHVLGAVMLGLWLAQWIVMALGPGGFPREKRGEGAIAKTYNILNMMTVLIVMPLVAILILTGYVRPLEATRIPVLVGTPLVVMETAGMAFYLTGHFLLSWARFSIGTSFQMGGVAPRSRDHLVVRGAYRVMRHPMYTALLCFDLGLFLMTQSVALLLLFAVLSAAIVKLVPIEEEQLVSAYGEQYAGYRKRVRALVPLVW